MIFSSFSVSLKVEVGGIHCFFLKGKGCTFSTIVVNYGLLNWYLLVKVHILGKSSLDSIKLQDLNACVLKHQTSY